MQISDMCQIAKKCNIVFIWVWCGIQNIAKKEM